MPAISTPKHPELDAEQSDYYEPNVAIKKGLIVAVHGGGWKIGKRQEMNTVCRLAVANQYSCLAVSYRLSKIAKYPAAIDDVIVHIERAQRVINKSASKFIIQRPILWGYSAGGQIVSWIGIQHPEAVAAVVAGGTPSDMLSFQSSDLVKSWMPVSDSDPMYLQLVKESSPFHLVKERPAEKPLLVPFFLYHGTWDWVVSYQQAEDFYGILKPKVQKIELYPVPYLGHFATFLLINAPIKKGIEFLDAL